MPGYSEISAPRPMDPLLSAYPGQRRYYPMEVTFPDPQPLDEPASIVIMREDSAARLNPKGLPFIGSMIDMCI